MCDPFSILVVDDNPAMASTLADIIAFKGFKVYAVTSGAEALEILHDHTIHILLADVKMPDMNGVALYKETKKTHPNLVTFLMTAFAADDIIQQGMAEGIKTVLAKPLDIDFLLALFSAHQRLLNKAG